MSKQVEIIKTFQDYQNVPNVPFLSAFTTKFIREYLDEIGVSYTENMYGIVVDPTKIDPKKPKILVMAHLDHPGIILKNNSEGVFMGLAGTKRLQDEVKRSNISIKIFDPKGVYLGKGKIKNVDAGFKQRVEIEANFEVPLNSFGQFDLNYFDQDEKNLYGYNADDGAAVAVLLQLIKDTKESNFNVYYLFNTHEEVHQLSSWYFAKTNYFGLTNRDFIVNLECLKVENIKDLVKNLSISHLENFVSEANYEDGVVLQLCNTGCLFGYKNKGENKAETLFKKGAKENNITLQIGLIQDSCDSRPFTQFALTPNIVSLTIPNKYKHNGADDGKVVAEVIKKKDLEDMYELMIRTLKTDLNKIQEKGKEEINISLQIKNQDFVTNYELMKTKGLLNRRLEIAYYSILSRKYFYPESYVDRVNDLISKCISYVKYYLSITLKLN